MAERISPQTKGVLIMFGKKTATALMLVFVMLFTLLAGCGSAKKQTLFTVNGNKVRKDDFMIHLFFNKYSQFSDYIKNGQMSMSDLYVFNDDTLNTEISDGVTLRDYLKTVTENSALWAVLYAQLAKENGLKLTSSEKRDIEDTVSSFITNVGGAAAFNTFLKKTGTTEDALRRYYENYRYYQKISTLFAEGAVNDLTEEEKAAAQQEYQSTYVTVKQIYLATVESDYKTSLSDATIAKKKQLSEEAYQAIKNGEDFDVACKKYNEAESNEITFAKGDSSVDDKVETAAFELNVGGTSGIISGSYGYYIIKRVDLKNDKLSSYYDVVRTSKMNAYLSEKSSSAEVVYKKAYDKLAIQ
jgi:parvulin-like peptidyl-prolyl isomerase